jgi:hypothetical protein
MKHGLVLAHLLATLLVAGYDPPTGPNFAIPRQSNDRENTG